MGETEAEKDILIALPEDMRHIGIVAHDLDRGADARDLDRIIIVGQGPRGEPIDQHQNQDAQRDEKHRQSDKPAKHQCHRGILDWRAD